MALTLLLVAPPEGVTIPAPRAILLAGPPGNGKTMLASATSRTLAEATSGRGAFFDVRLPSLLSKYFGESSRLLGELYRQARRRAPSIVFIDELDALTRDRDASDGGPERRILATLLSELDGLGDKGGRAPVLTLGATNRPWDLDPAILSRFERTLIVPPPDRRARAQILRHHLADHRLAPDHLLDEIARQTEGASGRDLEALARAALETMVARHNQDLTEVLSGDPSQLAGRRLRVGPIEPDEFDRALTALGPRDRAAIVAPYHRWIHPN